MIDTLKISGGRIVMLERGRAYTVRRGKSSTGYVYDRPGPGSTLVFKTAKGNEREIPLGSITSILMPSPKKAKEA